MDDFHKRPHRAQEPELLAIEAALFLEQSLGIPLGDEDMSEAILGDPGRLASFVTARMEIG